MSKARVDFWTDNNCKESLQRVKDYKSGKVDKETQQLIEMTIREEMIKNKRTPICPDEYENEEDYHKSCRSEWLGVFYDKILIQQKMKCCLLEKTFYLRMVVKNCLSCKET